MCVDSVVCWRLIKCDLGLLLGHSSRFDLMPGRQEGTEPGHREGSSMKASLGSVARKSCGSVSSSAKFPPARVLAHPRGAYRNIFSTSILGNLGLPQFLYGHGLVQDPP